MEQFLMEYLANSLWQVPLLAAGAWVILRALRPGSAVQHRVWLGVLPLMLAMPLLTPRAPSHPPIAPSPAPTAVSVSEAIPADALVPADSIPMQVEAQHTYQTANPAPEPPTASIPAPEPAPQPFSVETPHSSPAHSWRTMHEMTLTPSATHWLVALYLAVIAFMTLRLLGSAWAAWRLVAQAKPATLSDAASQQLDRCCDLFAVTRPRVLVSAHASSPMLVGAVRPSLLLPLSFATRLEDPAPHLNPELEAVWLHELSHLRRRDHFTNLLCRIAALPIAYHPAAHAVQQRIRQTREMVCDEMAAAEMQSPLSYARCLVGLARTMHGVTPSIEAVGMFDNGILEERIMQLTQSKTVVSARTRIIRLAGSAAMILAVMAAPAMFHLTPTLAQTVVSAPPAVVTTPAATPAPAATAEPAPQPPEQPQPATPARVRTAAAQAAESAESRESRESRKKSTEASAADAHIKAMTAESATHLDDARKHLDDAAKAYTDLAAKSATEAADTAESRQRLDEARKQLAEANRAWNEQVAEAVSSALRGKEFRIDTAELSKHLAETQSRLNSAEFRKQMADARAKFDSPEFKEKMQMLNKQMADAQAKFNSPEFKVQIEKLNNGEIQKHIADAQAKLNSPEFKEKMQKLSQQMAEQQAKLNSPEFKKQMQFQLQWKLDNSELGHMSVLNDNLSKQLDEVRQQIDDALKLWSENAPNR